MQNTILRNKTICLNIKMASNPNTFKIFTDGGLY